MQNISRSYNINFSPRHSTSYLQASISILPTLTPNNHKSFSKNKSNFTPLSTFCWTLKHPNIVHLQPPCPCIEPLQHQSANFINKHTALSKQTILPHLLSLFNQRKHIGHQPHFTQLKHHTHITPKHNPPYHFSPSATQFNPSQITQRKYIGHIIPT